VGRAGHDAVDLDDGRATALIRTTEPVALRAGDRFLIRRSGGADLIVGGVVLDVDPPRGLSRRRATSARMSATIAAVEANDRAAQRTARLDRHGVTVDGGVVALAPDVAAAAATAALDAVATEAPSATVRAAIARSIRRVATVRRDDLGQVTGAVLDGLVRAGRLVRAGDLVRHPDATSAAADPVVLAAMDRLERALTTSSPPSLTAAARDAGCPAEGLRQLERDGRIVRLSADLAYAAGTYAELTATALAMAATAPLTPAAYRDATGTSRKYVMAVLEDLDRRGILRRTPDGHRPGPRAAAAGSAPR
jgi:selenocysteine-specific elongation factor